jgi:hypothetical protein
MKMALTLASLLVLLGATHCNVFASKSCTLMGCVDGASGTAIVQVTTRDLLASTVTVCLNGACSSGKPTVQKECDTPTSTCDEGLYLRMSGAIQADVFLVAQGTTQHDAQLDASLPAVTDHTTSYELDVRVSGVAIHDGDTYTVTIAKDGAAPIFHLTKTYAPVYPNGPDCDGPNGVCRQASLS